jgi:hypothetical protein
MRCIFNNPVCQKFIDLNCRKIDIDEYDNKLNQQNLSPKLIYFSDFGSKSKISMNTKKTKKHNMIFECFRYSFFKKSSFEDKKARTFR